MRWPFVSRRAHEAVLADRERIRSERDQLVKDRDAQRLAAETASSLFTRTDEELAAVTIVNTCLTEDLTAVRERLAEVEAASCDTAATHWRAEAKREKKRADALQKAYDDAVGLKPRRIEDSSRWQPGYKMPEVDA